MTVLVQVRHARMILRASGRPICRAGIEVWCRRHGIDWEELSGNGVPIEVIAAIDNHHARLVVELAQKEHASGQQ